MFGTMMRQQLKRSKVYYLEIYRIYKEGIDSLSSMDTLCLKYIATKRQLNIIQE